MAAKKMVKFSLSQLGVTVGALMGITLFTLALLNMALPGIGGSVVALLAGLYPHYAATLTGAFAGLILGFIHGYIIGVLSNILMSFIRR